MDKKRIDIRSGFSLVELLVTISIISLLLAILTVGVQAAREAARRSKCANNLKQTALAVQAYHAAHQGLPALCTTYKFYNAAEKTDTETRIGTCGAQIFLLPFLEQEQIYEAFEAFASLKRLESTPEQISVNEPFPQSYTNVYTTGVRPRHWGAGVIISAFTCPSDGESGVIESPAREYDHFQNEGFPFDYTDWQFSRTNVMFNMGDAPLYNCDIDTPASKRGVFTPHSWKSFAHITDGLSNTLCLAESISGPPTDFRVYLNGGYQNISTSVREVAAAPDARNPDLMMVWPSICLESVSKTDPMRLDKVEPWGERGTYWFAGRPLANGFSTNLPPNTVTCSFGRSSFGAVLGGVSSFHPGGANAAMMDGSVRFIKDDIDTGDLFAPRSRIMETNQAVEGKSTYGVWGALGSINGGESVSL
ncbi:MAG: DUF1559 domain-containing protein [Thermoguttaceae bacterium]|nr:DUF1559 domain-containing protein [Thermoguttaceae bacterium]